MKFKIVFALFLLVCGSLISVARTNQGFDRAVFYSVMRLGKMADINEELDRLGAATPNEREAFAGALLMRKAGLVKIPAEKLKYFKRGRTKLETAIQNDRNNGEFRFLRLSIQEHAPQIVKYHTDLENDKQAIKKSFKDLLPIVQQAILDYSKNSIIIEPQDF